MAKRPNSGKKPAATEQYRKMYENTPHLCKSQVYNALYDKLRKERRLDRFIAVVQHCSMKGLSIDETCKTIVGCFPGYINEKDLTVECFTDMIQNYNDISVAWGYGSIGDEISQVMIKNKAFKLVEKSTSLSDIAIYQELFGRKEEISSEKDNKATVNFNLFKR